MNWQLARIWGKPHAARRIDVLILFLSLSLSSVFLITNDASRLINDEKTWGLN